ncbi:MAG: hypothetical protein IT385_25660 [Deltaproteobacteria bacterium]|nr:hypothetical protein [Deltaproteobacteria bacterium]
MAKGSGGDLLNDLLKEARKGVEQEQKQLANETARREQVEREAREKEEQRKREEAQQRLIEENRRRNEALARRDRSDGERKGERKAASTAKHERVQPATEGPITAAAPVAPPKAGRSRLIMAGVVVGGLAIGAGTGFALQPEMKGSFPDVDLAARSVVAQTARAASAQKRLDAQLGEVRGQLDGLNKQLGGAGTDLTSLRAEFNRLEGELAAVKKELADERARQGVKPPVTTITPGDGMPKLDDCTFGDCKKKKSP